MLKSLNITMNVPKLRVHSTNSNYWELSGKSHFTFIYFSKICHMVIKDIVSGHVEGFPLANKNR